MDRTLLYEGSVLSNAKKPLLALLFTDCIVFLQDRNQKLSFAQFGDKKPAVIPLEKVQCVRSRPEMGTAKETTFFIIVWRKGDTNPFNYELTCGDPREREKWQAEIENARSPLRAAGKDAVTSHLDDDLVIDETQLLKIRDIIGTFLCDYFRVLGRNLDTLHLNFYADSSADSLTERSNESIDLVSDCSID